MTDPLLPTAQTVVKNGAAYTRDLAERVVSTGLEAFVGALVLSAPFDLTMWHNAAVAGVAAGASLLKGLAARVRDVTNSASLARGV
ncbi:hypothetical protein ACIGNW_00325 [Streptomyces sp. NPDC053707]|uniref:hypothetical protein n=1 Tax=Streptomyces sp. NPDC053707 TaxID=3365712 RepID=UPI0037D6D46E